MLNARISLAQFNQLTEVEQSHYVKKGDVYVIDVNGDTPEMEQLRQSNGQLHQQVLKAENNAAQANAKVKTADADAEAKYKAQLDAANESLTTMRTAAVTERQNTLIEGIASQFQKPELFRAMLRDMITVELDEKGAVVEKFKNAKGEACTLEQLSDSYCKSPDYSAMLAKPVSTPTFPTNQPPAAPAGGGNTNQPLFAPQQGGVGGSAPTANWGLDAQGKPVVYDWGKMSDAETSAYAAAKVAAEGQPQ